jgi:adenylate cyclase
MTSAAVHADPIYLTALAGLGQIARDLKRHVPAASIAVLPFSSLSGDEEQEHFADGLTEDIITDLSSRPGLFVIARNSCFAYKGRAQDVRQIAYDLGVKYILEGSVRKSAQRVRINVQLNDAAEGNQVWAERFDRELTSIFDVQDELTERVVEAAVGKLGPQTRIERPRPGNLRAYDLCVRGRNLWTQSKAANEDASSLFSQALALEPNYAEAHWRLALSQLFCWLQYGEDQVVLRPAALASAQRAVALDPKDAGARWALGFILSYEGHWEDARREILASIEMNPNDADARSILSDFLFLDGKPVESLEAAAISMRLDPHPPGWLYWLMGQAQIANGQYEQAVATLSRPETYRTLSRRVLAVALALLGRRDEAKQEVGMYLASDPGWTFGPWLATRPFQKTEDIAFWRDAYLMAGFRE